MDGKKLKSLSVVEGSKVIPFRSASKAAVDTASIKMMKIADEIDAVILKHVENGDVDPKELAGLISHRLGSLMKNIDHKAELLDVCIDVMRKQAELDQTV